jgi:hypothetical protein
MEKESIKQHGREGGGQATTDYKPITNNQLDPGSNPGGAINNQICETNLDYL